MVSGGESGATNGVRDKVLRFGKRLQNSKFELHCPPRAHGVEREDTLEREEVLRKVDTRMSGQSRWEQRERDKWA